MAIKFQSPQTPSPQFQGQRPRGSKQPATVVNNPPVQKRNGIPVPKFQPVQSDNPLQMQLNKNAIRRENVQRQPSLRTSQEQLTYHQNDPRNQDAYAAQQIRRQIDKRTGRANNQPDTLNYYSRQDFNNGDDTGRQIRVSQQQELDRAQRDLDNVARQNRMHGGYRRTSF